MPPSGPTISVVMPNYNHAYELKSSLAAIADQHRPPDEVILVDDASTDDSLDVIQTFASRCPALRLLRQPERQGVIAAVNRGLQEARGDYVILASADEQILPNMCRDMEAGLASCPDAHLVVSKFTEWFPETGALGYGEDGDFDFWFLKGDAPRWVSPAEFEALLRQRHVRLSVNSAMFKRSTFLSIGMLDPVLKWHSDWFAIYATAFRYSFVALPRTLSWYRVTPTSYSSMGVATAHEQQQVVENLLAKLETEEFENVHNSLLRAPSAMTPFMRPLLTTLLKQPTRYYMLVRIMRWWVREVARGKRPKAWAKTRVAKKLRRWLGQDVMSMATNAGQRADARAVVSPKEKR